MLWSTFCVDHHHDRSSLPCYDRTVIVDTRGLEGVFLNERWKRRTLSSPPPLRALNNGACDDKLVRTSFVLGFGEMDKIKSRIRVLNLQQQPKHSQLLDLISPYVVTCAFLWVCVRKTQERVGRDSALHHDDEDPNFFGFVAGELTWFEHPVPVTYLGNCVRFGRAKAVRDRWILEWAELIRSDIHVMACRSPKVDFYGRDFGWGKPKKIEEIEIDSTKAISLSES
ncbi:phenolic glucoside malonyltransferase 1-like [Humulus lupulus]|uniref:phenolic glucoside malonyltransferase 1-like n=1 Tax=Humulus lupulus TaxID=3486 RepID=UPI002B407B89|nr:phenolic glucoside malonyltransferase 1-like [Humulus lupulus]